MSPWPVSLHVPGLAGTPEKKKTTVERRKLAGYLEWHNVPLSFGGNKAPKPIWQFLLGNPSPNQSETRKAPHRRTISSSGVTPCDPLGSAGIPICADWASPTDRFDLSRSSRVERLE